VTVDCAQVAGVIKCKTDSRQLEKYRQYVDEMERVTRLLLLLAGRLARFDNSLLQLPPTSGDSQSNSLVFLLRLLHCYTTVVYLSVCLALNGLLCVDVPL